MRTRPIAAAALGAALSTLAVAGPAQATGNDPALPESVMWITEDTDCHKTPHTLSSGRVLDPADLAAKATIGTVYDSSVTLDPNGGNYRQVSIDGTPCFVEEHGVSEIKGDLDASTFTTMYLLPDEQYSGMLLADAASALFGAGSGIHSMPSKNSTTLAVLEVGDVAIGADWETLGELSMVGRDAYIPVSYGDSLGWLASASVAAVPAYALTDLTSSLTPTQDLTVHAAPTTTSDVIGSLDEGTTVAAQTAAWAGFLPVDLDGTVGWVEQASLIAVPTETPTVDPSEEPGWFEEKKEEYLNGKTDPEEKADEPGLVEKAKNWFTGENPVAAAAAKASLYVAGGVALLALLLAGIAHAGTRSVRRAGKSLAGHAVTLAAPGAQAAVVFGAPVAALVAGVVAAFLAPASYFVAQVLGGAALLGLVFAYVTAHRVAAMRNVPEAGVVAGAKADSTLLLIAAGGVALGVHFILGLSLPVALVIGFAAAGVAAGFRTPQAPSDASPTSRVVAPAPPVMPHDPTPSEEDNR